MKIVVTIVLIFSTFANALDCTQVEDKKYAEVVAKTVKGKGQLNSGDFDTIEKNLIFLASTKSSHANKLLISLFDFSIGAGQSELLGQIITEKKKAILPLLKKAYEEKSKCDPRKYNCVEARGYILATTMKAVEHGETTGSGDEISYIKAKDLKRLCSEPLQKDQ